MRRTSCLFPSICQNLNCSAESLIKMMDALIRWKTSSKKVNVYVASGVRHDLALQSKEYIDLLAKHFVGGHLKVAPEHYCPKVLEFMGKPPFEVFEKFEACFNDASRRAGKEQYLIPYFITAHPGCTPEDALKLTEYLISRSWRPRQVQDFVPIPLSMSAAMFFTGQNSRGKGIHIPRGRTEKQLQAALLQYYDPRNTGIIAEYLSRRNREDLLPKISRLAAPQSKDKKRY